MINEFSNYECMEKEHTKCDTECGIANEAQREVNHAYYFEPEGITIRVHNPSFWDSLQDCGV